MEMSINSGIRGTFAYPHLTTCGGALVPTFAVTTGDVRPKAGADTSRAWSPPVS